MHDQAKADIIRSLFTAYKNRTRNVVEDLLTDDFTFTSPYDDAIDKTAYFERCWPNSERIKQHVLEAIFIEGDAAFVTYSCEVEGGKQFRNTEFFAFDADRIASVDVYFGATYKDGVFVKQA
ncbi:nuclear transport factor 2 family protein [Bradyrhizobium prioriisuperbiae]|uniref:nuclear transport factor 2 family protein n=1 Tax=Bradyrhizobium prioriisuperbiae TaxID=2854389 RepID=UPI0028E591EF|nr:nuclear transport factor 2 family protein [Bradyrhizobium prioritasuperba]